ncbi:cysteine desulfurase family protein [Syntrophorhabdus aromaticivorans]|uniref:cysteine desulfurase n=1 Tax=Syntrophorhabdus aromaticivorans TaxID=328301 RepID=A0A971S0N6_9BACT|nr:cysteine desulfurase family protein [Syntrophorhabdus aromaticivorans]NLW35296.1 cysteine desulfurase [Syntrophorhabdus aromaticivorans]
MQTIYLDHISGTPLHPQVKEVMTRYIQENFGNPISQHKIGDAAMEALETAREKVASLINAKASEVVFTSGGSESINHAIKGIALAAGEKKRHIITSNIEHQSVQRSLRMLMKLGFRITSLPVDHYGLIDPKEVEKAISDDTILVTIMHANNEIGTLEPIAEIGKITRAHGIAFHTDAVASIGVVPFDVDEMGVDLASLAANQFYGPPGVGALYIRSGTRIVPLIDGGIQENNQRAGTQNMVGIVGMGKAAELARKEMSARTEHVLRLKRAFMDRLTTIEDITFHGHPDLCLPHLLSFSVHYVEGESMVLMLDEKNVCLSTRSACASGSLRASHVLIATGVDYAAAQGTLIFSCGIMNTMEELDAAFNALKDSIAFLRNISPLYRKKREGGREEK